MLLLRPTRRAGMQLFAAVLFAALLAGCTSVIPYDSRTDGPMNAYKTGNVHSAADNFARSARQYDGRNEGLLWKLEAGKAAQAAGNFPQSIQWFSAAESDLRQFEDEPVIMGRDALADAGALLSNQSVLPYRGFYTDRIFLNTYQSLNFLATGNLEAAGVESRRAMLRQDQASQYYESEIRSAEDDYTWGFDALSEQELGPVYRHTAGRITPAAAQFLNPFTSWLRAVVLHLQGDYSGARQSLRTVLQMGSQGENLQNYYAGLGVAETGAGMPPYCFVVFENGIGPSLKEMRIQLVLPKLGYTVIALPEPVYFPLPFGELLIEDGAGGWLDADVVAMTDGLFSAEFRARFPGILMRSLASYTAKEVGSRAAVINTSDDLKILTYLATGLYKYASTQADTRTWRTRGNQFQVAAFPLPDSGELILRSQSLSPGGSWEETISLPATNQRQNVFIYIQAPSARETLTVERIFDMD